jgi:hypothetical protein
LISLTGKIELTLGGQAIVLDDLIDAPDEENLRQARAELQKHLSGGLFDSKLLWVWYVQAGHHFAKEGQPDLALRAYLNKQRLCLRDDEAPGSRAVMTENIALCLQELGDFEHSGQEHVVAGEGFIETHQEGDAAAAFENAGLAWERLVGSDENRPRLGTANGRYDSTICFRRAKYLYASQGDFDGTSRCTVLERDAERRWTTSGSRRSMLSLMRWLWLYGESPARVLLNATGVWFCSAVAYF